MELRTVLANSLYAVVRPLARIAMRHGLTVRDFQDITKKAFVDIAREEYGIRGRPTNKSRIAALTGLARVEVSRLLEIDAGRNGKEIGGRHPLNRIVTAWLRDPPWSGDGETPAALSVDGPEPSFAALVRHVGGDLPYQTLLRELQRMDIVGAGEGGVRLLCRGFIPRGAAEVDRLPFLGENAGALIDTIAHNLDRSTQVRRFERKVVFPGLDRDGMQKLATIAEQDGQALLEAINAGLTPHAEATPKPGRITGLGMYVFDTHTPHGGPFE